MRVNIFDNGMRSKTGHHFDFCLRLAKSCRARGYAVQVYGAIGTDANAIEAFAAADCPFVPLFSHFAYAPLDLGANIMAALERQARVMAGELSHAAPAELNLFPALKPLEFYGVSLSDLAGTCVGYAHAEPFHQGPVAAQVWRIASEHVRRRGLKFRMGAIDPLIAEFLAGYLDGIPVEAFPIALDGPGKAEYARTLTTIGFFGSQREERGFDIVAPLAEQLLALGHRVVLHDTHGRFTNNNGNPKLHILDNFVDDLGTEMARCDAIVCPMRPDQYAHRMSGIVCNAMACGIPVVLPAGTLAAARFGASGAVRCYLEHSVGAILQAVQGLGREYSRYAEAARQGALQWRATHGMERFVDKVTGLPA